jgi:hypothetical protein
MQPFWLRSVVAAAFIVSAVSSCASSTSPESRALDGPWTSGPACLSLGLNLSWTNAGVSGSGTYRTDIGPTTCGAAPLLAASGAVVLDAHRKSSTSLEGTMTFDGKTRATFLGTLTITGGSGSIVGTAVTPDGRALAFGISEGLIP